MQLSLAGRTLTITVLRSARRTIQLKILSPTELELRVPLTVREEEIEDMLRS